MSEFGKRLQDMQEPYSSTPEQGSSVPAGVYKMQIQEATVFEAQSSGDLGVRVELLVIEGEQEGQVVPQFFGFSAKRVPFLKRFIRMMGYEPPEDVREVEEIIADIKDKCPVLMANVVKSRDGQFTNVNITRLLEGEAGAAPEPQESRDPAAEPEPEPEPAQTQTASFSKGDDVMVTADGKETAGTVEEYDGGQLIQVDVGDPEGIWEVEVDSVRAAEPPSNGDDERLALVEVAQAHDIAVSDDDDVDTIKAALLDRKWDKAQLDQTEVDRLEAIGAEFKKPPLRKVTKKAAPKRAVKKRKK